MWFTESGDDRDPEVDYLDGVPLETHFPSFTRQAHLRDLRSRVSQHREGSHIRRPCRSFNTDYVSSCSSPLTRTFCGRIIESFSTDWCIKIDRHVNADQVNFPSPAGNCGGVNIRQTTNTMAPQVPNHALNHPALSGNREILVPVQRRSAVRCNEIVVCRLSSSGEPDYIELERKGTKNPVNIHASCTGCVYIVRRPSGG